MQRTPVVTRTDSTGRNPGSLRKPLHKRRAGKTTLRIYPRTGTAQRVSYTDTLGNYLYEPNASLLKAGAFRSIAAAYSVKKLHPNSHLYTSETQIEGFPGRTFRIINRCSLNKKEIKENLSDLKKANITVRNFPATVAELRKRIKLAEGGDTYLFASTLNDGQKILIRCGKV